MKQFVNVMYRVLFVSIALALITKIALNVTPVNVMFHSPDPSVMFDEMVAPTAEYPPTSTTSRFMSTSRTRDTACIRAVDPRLFLMDEYEKLKKKVSVFLT